MSRWCCTCNSCGILLRVALRVNVWCTVGVVAAVHPWFSAVGYTHLRVSRVIQEPDGSTRDIPIERAPGVEAWDPEELTDEQAARKLLGPGRFKISARGDGGKLYGKPYRVEFLGPDGRPVLTDADLAKLYGEDEGRESFTARDVIAILREQQKLERERHAAEVAAVQRDRKADFELFNTMLQGALANRSDDRFLAFMMKQHEAHETSQRKHELQLRELEVKLAKRKGSDGDEEFWGKVVAEGLPMAREFLTRGAKKEKPAAPTEEQKAETIPSAAAMREHLSAGGSVSSKALGRLVAAAQQGKLDGEQLEIVRALSAKALGLSAPARTGVEPVRARAGADREGAGAGVETAGLPSAGAGAADPPAGAGGGVST